MQVPESEAIRWESAHCPIHVCVKCLGKFIKTRGEKQKVCLICLSRKYADIRK